MSALAIVRSNALHVYYHDRSTPVGGTIPTTAIADMEVINEEEFSRVIAKLVPVIARTRVATILILSEELCFMLPLAGQSKEDVERRLVTLTPFSHVSTVLLTIQNQQYLVATNQDLYESVARVLSLRDHETILVIPWVFLVQSGLTKGEMDMVTVKRAFDNQTVLRSGAFPLPAQHTELPSAPAQTTVKTRRKYPWGWILFGSMAALYAVLTYWFFIR